MPFGSWTAENGSNIDPTDIILDDVVPINTRIIGGMSVQEFANATQGMFDAVIGTSVIKGTYTPTITINAGASNAVAQVSNYDGTGDETGVNNMIDVTTMFTIDVDGSNSLVDINITVPVGTPASVAFNGDPVIILTANYNANLTSNIASGTGVKIAVNGSDVRLRFETAQASQNYTVGLAFKYKVA